MPPGWVGVCASGASEPGSHRTTAVIERARAPFGHTA